MINENLIRWVLNGERINEGNVNRPTRDLLSELNDKLTYLDETIKKKRYTEHPVTNFRFLTGDVVIDQDTHSVEYISDSEDQHKIHIPVNREPGTWIDVVGPAVIVPEPGVTALSKNNLLAVDRFQKIRVLNTRENEILITGTVFDETQYKENDIGFRISQDGSRTAYKTEKGNPGQWYEVNSEWYYIVKDNADLIRIVNEFKNLPGQDSDHSIEVTLTGGIDNPGVPIPINRVVTSLVTEMIGLFMDSDFNQKIDLWDTSGVTTTNSLFKNSKFNQDLNNLDVSSIQDMESMFEDSIFNQDLNKWDTSSVKTMKKMFKGSLFNKDIRSWDTSSVLSMESMFEMSEFNQPLNGLDTSNVKSMEAMFRNSAVFNSQVNALDTSSVLSMKSMFSGATKFDQPIKDWNVSEVKDFSNMFSGTKFNKSLLTWNTGSAENMSSMFYSNRVFNQDIGLWNTSKVTNMDKMFYDAFKFNQDLSRWCVINIPSLPTDFYVLAESWDKRQREPLWGTCP